MPQDKKREQLRGELLERDRPGLRDDLAKLRAISDEMSQEQRRDEWWDQFQVALFGFDPDEEE